MVEAVKNETTAPKAKDGSPRPRWARFSLRWLFVLMLLVGLGLGWLARVLHAGWSRAAMVAAVRAADGEVEYDNEYTARISRTPAGPPTPWQVYGSWLGHDAVHQVAKIWSDPFSDFLDPPQQPIPLTALNYCTELREVRLSGGLGIEENVARLGASPGLTGLYLFGEVTNRGLAPLRNHARLQVMILCRVPPGGEPIAELPHSPGLVELYLYNFPVSDQVLSQIGGLQMLETLALDRMELSDDRLQPLAGLSRVTTLSLDGNPLRGPGLAMLATLPKLESLSLRHCPIEDEALPSLVRFPRLRRVQLERGPSAAAVQALEEARPSLRIEWFDRPSDVKEKLQ